MGVSWEDVLRLCQVGLGKGGVSSGVQGRGRRRDDISACKLSRQQRSLKVTQTSGQPCIRSLGTGNPSLSRGTFRTTTSEFS